MHCLAKELIKRPDLIDNNDMQFSCNGHSYYSHALVVKPSGSLGKKCNVFLKVVPESDIYNLNKFSLNINNIGSQWYFNNSVEKGIIFTNVLY